MPKCRWRIFRDLEIISCAFSYSPRAQCTLPSSIKLVACSAEDVVGSNPVDLEAQRRLDTAQRDPVGIEDDPNGSLISRRAELTHPYVIEFVNDDRGKRRKRLEQRELGERPAKRSPLLWRVTGRELFKPVLHVFLSGAGRLIVESD